MTEFDINLFLYLNQLLAGSIADLFFTGVTFLGNGLVLLLLVTPLMVLGSRDKFRAHFVALVLSVALGGLLVHGIKFATESERPPRYFASRGINIHIGTDIPATPSFPSGHAQTAFAVAVYLCLLYRKWTWTVPLLLAATAVGLSRIALGVHFPLDVLAGALTGAGCAALGYRINGARLKKKSASC
ncbi:MAG: phosphatase PAP2 family protein [Deltaproteobacteria bacterium]|nr:phosphatase PAP2 family protein [Deltaproteobacteria bacterium]